MNINHKTSFLLIFPVTFSDGCPSQVKTTKTNLMRNLLFSIITLFSFTATAKDSEASKVLTQVFNDPTIYKYLLKYECIDSLGYAIIENQGHYYIYDGNIKNKESALTQPSIGKIRKMKITPKSAFVKASIKNNHINIKARLSRIDSSNPWFVDSRMIGNLFQVRKNLKKFCYYYSNSNS